ncbi:Ribonuclease H domain [Dillenia turbinata]|uniref:Ribonuclease H domain n=1 Tax=Dillenia turbinata TaxID=194707 RepID=A0AAN8Z426_9MAGN
MMAELWGLRKGLRIAKSRNLKKIEVEMDLKIIANLLSEDPVDNHPMEAILQECRLLMLEVEAEAIKHIYREAKCCADKLVRMGQEMSPGVGALAVLYFRNYYVLMQAIQIVVNILVKDLLYLKLKVEEEMLMRKFYELMTASRQSKQNDDHKDHPDVGENGNCMALVLKDDGKY